MKSIRCLLLVLGFLVAWIPIAHAHAFVDHADPPVGGSAHSSLRAVKIWFTRKLDPTQSKVQVFDAVGKEVDRGDSKVDSVDTTLMFVSVPTLPKGTYKVIWKAVCLDTHTTHGNFTFEVTGP